MLELWSQQPPVNVQLVRSNMVLLRAQNKMTDKNFKQYLNALIGSLQ